MITNAWEVQLEAAGFRRSEQKDFKYHSLYSGESEEALMVKFPWVRDDMPYSDDYIKQHGIAEVCKIHDRIQASARIAK